MRAARRRGREVRQRPAKPRTAVRVRSAPLRLFLPEAHEPLTERAWDETVVRDAVVAIAADAERAFDPDRLWPAHPLDEEPESARFTTLYLGAAGMVWGLDRLARLGAVELTRDWAAVAAALPERYAAEPDFEEEYGGRIPSLMIGEAGVLLVAHGFSPTAELERRLLEVVRDNERIPTRELVWGSPGTMLAAHVLWERTGDAAWLDAWRTSADWLWDEWQGDVWEQELGDRRRHVLGPAHGLAGNVFVLARGELLDPDRRRELERRTIETLSRHALRDDGLAQWPPSLEEVGKPAKFRVQWCHGAPGIVASLASLAPGDEELTALLEAGGELTWQAGPLVKGAGLCHGTAGNGYAFLKLLDRTGDERWLERARRFAMHAVEQVERTRERHGRGRYTLFTGDVGTALYLQSCLDADSAFPTLDVF
jgi:Lanthionine synthetase C-like protein